MVRVLCYVLLFLFVFKVLVICSMWLRLFLVLGYCYVVSFLFVSYVMLPCYQFVVRVRDLC